MSDGVSVSLRPFLLSLQVGGTAGAGRSRWSGDQRKEERSQRRSEFARETSRSCPACYLSWSWEGERRGKGRTPLRHALSDEGEEKGEGRGRHIEQKKGVLTGEREGMCVCVWVCVLKRATFAFHYCEIVTPPPSPKRPLCLPPSPFCLDSFPSPSLSQNCCSFLLFVCLVCL
jgi:hypothetical protein